jgi:1-acyl-sn-glycerol-3-phosphate acyltransferase
MEQTGLPVVPVGIVGTTDDFWHKASKGKRPQLEMHIGRPVKIQGADQHHLGRKESRQLLSDLVMRHIAGLLPKEYRGFYSPNAIFPEQ